MIPGHQNAILSRCERFQQLSINLDLYKQPFRLLLPDEKDEYRTFAGAILTICTFFLGLIYAVIKLQILFGYEDYKVQSRDFGEYYKETDMFTHLDGFAVAAGIPTGPYGQAHTGVPQNVGALKFYRKEYTPGSAIDFVEIPTRKCSRKDFNFGDGSDTSDALFYLTKKSVEDLENHWEDLLCPIDANDWYGSGNYDSSSVKNFMVVFEKCDQAKETEGSTGLICLTDI